jgi:DNA-binding NtrC family response regulator
MKIVIVDDDEVTLHFCQRVLQDYETFTFKDPKKALQYCEKNTFDLILSDMRMPSMTGIGLIQEIRKKTTDFATIIFSAFGDANYLIDAVNASNISHYFLKPVEANVLLAKVKEALHTLNYSRNKRAEEKQLEEQARKLAAENNVLRFNAESPLGGLVGTHPSILKTKEQIKSFSLSDHPVHICGEAGTGKKMVARIIHEVSSRKTEPFVNVSSSSIPEELLEVELFGAAKAGSKPARDGFVARAEGGTLFIEDVQLLPKTVQAKLLKFLTYGNYYPVGATEERSADVRVLVSSTTNLIHETDKGEFRKELFYKITTLQIRTLPLRERRDDILVLMEALARKGQQTYPSLDTKQKDLLVKYAFPGNIRELGGILEKLNLSMRTSGKTTVAFDEIERLLKENAQIYAADQGMDASVKTIQLPVGHEPVNMREFVDAIEKDIIIASLKHNDNNISQTSRNLLISRQGLKNKIKRYEIPVDIDDDEDDEGEETDQV